jgi:hypothetical protein
VAVLAAAGPSDGAGEPVHSGKAVWPAFGYDAAGSDDDAEATAITAGDLSALAPKVVHLPGTVDSSAVYLRNVVVEGARRDVYVVDTTYGRTFAIDAATATVLWQFVPRGISAWEGTLEITTSSPVVDPSLRYVYTASPEGRVHKLQLATGREIGGRWPVRVTHDPTKEKISSSLETYGPYLLVALAGLSQKIGLPYPRVGHLVAIDRRTGRIAHVLNSECSNRRTVIAPGSCRKYEAGIWARIPATVDPAGNLLVATADGYWDGQTFWGDSVLELSPSLGLLQSYTPGDQSKLAQDDLDLGSTAPTLLTKHIVLQVGKDGVIRLLDLRELNGRRHAAARISAESSPPRRRPGAARCWPSRRCGAGPGICPGSSSRTGTGSRASCSSRRRSRTSCSCGRTNATARARCWRAVFSTRTTSRTAGSASTTRLRRPGRASRTSPC